MKVKIIKDNQYHHQFKAEYISKKKQGPFIHPVVWSIDHTDTPKFVWSSTTNNGHYGIPKVIFSWGAGLLLDIKGEFAVSQFACGIIDTPENLPKIKQAMKTEKFQTVMRYTNVGPETFAWRVIRSLRHDFWRDFL